MEINKINEKSELHDRYMQYLTTDIILPLNTGDESNYNLCEKIMSYNYEIIKEELDENKLKSCKMLLCKIYQTTYKKQIKICEIDRFKIKNSLPNIEMIFPPHRCRSWSQISLLCDIIILQMILYFDINLSVEFMQNFFCLHQAYLREDTSRTMYMEIIEYLLEFLRLQRNNPGIYLHIIYVIEIMKFWMKEKKDSEWWIFASMFHKLVDIFSREYIVNPLWNYALRDINDIKESLTLLTIMADTCFLTLDTSYIHYDIYQKDTFWLRVLKGLASQQCRKQALYIMKTAVNSLNKNIRSNLITSEYMKAEITPFICNQIIVSPSVDCVKEKFFLVYEALEQVQDDLVMPALTHVTDLIEANKNHNMCNCFDIVWLRCIFEKILTHESTQVTRWGVAHVLKLDEAIFDVHFLEIFINTLNNTFLYECQSAEDCPEIVGELTEFFKRAQKSYLFKEFIRHINKNTIWEPLTIFYVIYALRIISPKEAQYCAWETDELKAIKLLVQKSLSSSSSIPSTACQIELLRAICNYVRQIDDLPLLADVLATFSCLAKETNSWNIITTWLSNILPNETATAFISITCKQYLNAETPENFKIFAMMICLLYDANLIFQQRNNECPALESLNNLLHSWNMSFNIFKNIDAAEFISHLIDIGTKDYHEGMLKFISLHIETTFTFLIDKMRVMSWKLTFQDYTKYTNIVSSHLNSLSFISVEVTRNTQSYAEKLQRKSINLVKDLQSNVNMQYLYGLHILYLSQEIYPDCLNNYKEDILYILSMEKKIISEYFLLLSRLVYQYLVNNSLETLGTSIGTLLSYLQQFFEFLLPENVSEIAKILRIVIDKFMCEEDNEYIKIKETFMHIFNNCFMCIMDNMEDFWTAMQSLMEVIINNNFLRLPDAGEFTIGHIRYFLSKEIFISKFNKIVLSGLMYLDVNNVFKLEMILKVCLFHLPMYHCNAKIEDHAHLFIAKHLNKDYSENIFTLDHNDFVATRVEAIIILHKIISYSEAKYGEIFARHVIHKLVQNKMQLYERLPLYKVQHRQMQILLILEPILSKELILLIYEDLCHFIYTESNPHSSVRLMQEWLMIRILVKNNDLHEELWSLFEKSIENRPSCTISLASIVYHVAKLLSDDNQKIFIERALPYIERLLRAFILTHLYELMKSYNDENASKYKRVYQMAVAGLQQESSMISSVKIQDDFYFSHFHPINDYSLQTIYYEFPRLTNMSFDEWISPDVFEKLTFEERDRHPLRLYNTNSLLSDTKSSAYLTKSFAETIALNDVSEVKELIYTLDIKQEGLIIVASFVDQLPNLDDIVKICKTFHIRALIITNTDYSVRNEELQYLTVSADKWLNMIQVKQHELLKFLLNRKKEGWSLIGAAHTENSVDITRIMFSKKAIFILGNEKDGSIPAHFISVFHTCVEIKKQYLTVTHTSKHPLSVDSRISMCIWQYIHSNYFSYGKT
ncbi:hypothetical protein P5V15_012171 [Pogonomyrmex californicus]